MDAMKLAEVLSVMSMLEESEMNTNNYDAHHAVIKYGKPVTRKTVYVSQRRFSVDQLRRDK